MVCDPGFAFGISGMTMVKQDFPARREQAGAMGAPASAFRRQSPRECGSMWAWWKSACVKPLWMSFATSIAACSAFHFARK